MNLSIPYKIIKLQTDKLFDHSPSEVKDKFQLVAK
jgi:hypothetical protein